MDIRTKLIFAFVATTLASMLVLGAAFYNASAGILQSIAVRQLQSLVAARQQDLKIVADGWFDQVRLISSRTKLRDSLKQYVERPSDELRNTMQGILRDAQRAVGTMTRLALYDVDNRLITQSGAADAPLQLSVQSVKEDVQFSGFHERERGGIDVIILARLVLNEEVVGILESVVNTDDVLALTGDYTGLGSSGEFYLVAEITPGQVTVLNPLRHRDADKLLSYSKSQAPAHVLAALDRVDGVFRDTRDYRGVRVWAATRHLPRAPSGVIVKIDEEVELARVYELREELSDLALALAAFAVLAGTFMGFHLSKPLRVLTTVVDRIRRGERSVRVEVSGEDELSLLAESFNELMDDLQVGSDQKPDD